MTIFRGLRELSKAGVALGFFGALPGLPSDAHAQGDPIPQRISYLECSSSDGNSRVEIFSTGERYETGRLKGFIKTTIQNQEYLAAEILTTQLQSDSADNCRTLDVRANALSRITEYPEWPMIGASFDLYLPPFVSTPENISGSHIWYSRSRHEASPYSVLTRCELKRSVVEIPGAYVLRGDQGNCNGS